MSAQGDRPAFPTAAVETWDYQVERWLTSQASQGMTLREHYAGLAMQGMVGGMVGLLNGEPSAYAKGACNAVVADRAVALADALLEALEAKP